MYSIGKVKWFGGTNSKTGKSNDYGFVTDANGEDAFLHATAWKESTPPDENDIVVYSLERDHRGWRAANAARSQLDEPKLGTVMDLIDRLVLTRHALRGLDDIEQHVLEMARETLLHADANEIQLLLLDKARSTHLWELLATASTWKSDLLRIAAAAGTALVPCESVPWRLLPDTFFLENESEVAGYLGSIDIGDARQLARESFGRMPTTLLTYLASIGAIDSSLDLGDRQCSIDDLIEQFVVDDEVVGPDYLSAHVRARYGHHFGLGNSPVLAPAMDRARFRRMLFEKDSGFVEIYDTSSHLKSRVDYFLLVTIFGSIVAGNGIDTVYRDLDERLWTAVASGEYNLRAQSSRQHLLALMPSCKLLNYKRLSCEAFFWKADGKTYDDLFLCRGKRCRDPQVFPMRDRSWRNFTLYDWFDHYEVNYATDERPAKKDFPIKLAGYFNRVIELLGRLDCRDCGQLMLPDWRYARVSRWEQTPTGRVWVNHQAAYRSTVFRCANDDCGSCGEKHYINHCLGFKCYEIIDSRDLEHRCDQGRYVCSCGSCCRQHEESARWSQPAPNTDWSPDGSVGYPPAYFESDAADEYENRDSMRVNRTRSGAEPIVLR